MGPVHYREWPGPVDGPTFVCVHGLGGSLLNWAGVAPDLAGRGRVMALDLAGFGLTPPEGRSTHVGANRRLLDGFLDVLDLPPVVLGNSMGGMVSLIQAAHAPTTVSALVLVDAPLPRTRRIAPQYAPWVVAMFALYSSRHAGPWFVTKKARRLGAEGLVRQTFEICAADPSAIDPALVEAHVELARTHMAHPYAAEAYLKAARSIFRAQASPDRYRRLARAVTRPALVIHGPKDRLVPFETAQDAAREHLNWDLVALPDLGHIPQMEAPSRWLDAVESWLDHESVEVLPSAS
jgi:pimeloyl-ACP methyl ester carboxylesterase